MCGCLMLLLTHLQQYCKSQSVTLRHLFIGFHFSSIFPLCPCLAALKRVFEGAVEFDQNNLFFRPSGGRNGDAFFRLIETKSRYEMRQS